MYNSNMNNINVYKFKNGFNLIVLPTKNFSSAVLRLYVGSGSCYESSSMSGSLHFVEHLISRQIRLKVERNMGSWLEPHIISNFDSFITRNYICHSFDIYKKDVSSVIELFMDVLKNPVWDSFFNSEKKIILSEIKNSKNSFYYSEEENYLKNYFGENSLAKPIFGNCKNVENFDLKNIKEVFKNNYSPENFVLVVTGNVKKNKIKKQIKNSFGKLVSVNNSFKSNIFNLEKNKTVFLKEKRNQVSFSVSRFISIKNSLSLFKYNFIRDILYDYLNYYLREKKQLVYSCSVFIEEFKDFINFIIEADIDKKDFLKFYNELFDLLRSFKDNFNYKDLTIAKDVFIKEIKLDHDYPLTQAKTLGHMSILLGVNEAVNYWEKIEDWVLKINKDDVIKTMINLLNSPFFIHIVGDLDEDKYSKKIKKIF